MLNGSSMFSCLKVRSIWPSSSLPPKGRLDNTVSREREYALSHLENKTVLFFLDITNEVFPCLFHLTRTNWMCFNTHGVVSFAVWTRSAFAFHCSRDIRNLSKEGKPLLNTFISLLLRKFALSSSQYLTHILQQSKLNTLHCNAVEADFNHITKTKNHNRIVSLHGPDYFSPLIQTLEQWFKIKPVSVTLLRWVVLLDAVLRAGAPPHWFPGRC